MSSIEILKSIKENWDGYINYLKEKYPPKDGEEWACTCPFHKKIDIIIDGIDIEALQKESDDEFDELLMFNALEQAGVDNWLGYDEAVEIFTNMKMGE